MRRTARIAVLPLLLTLGLGACSATDTDADDGGSASTSTPVDDSDAPAPSPSPTAPTEESAPEADDGPCPATLTVSEEAVTDQPSSRTQARGAAVRAFSEAATITLCGYTEASTSEDWTTKKLVPRGTPHTLSRADEPLAATYLSGLSPLPTNRACPMDLGPDWLLVAQDGRGRTTAAARVEEYGCRATYLTDDLTHTVEAGLENAFAPDEEASRAWQDLTSASSATQP